MLFRFAGSTLHEQKKGRPKGKKYPQPHDIFEGFRIASYGKLGAGLIVNANHGIV